MREFYLMLFIISSGILLIVKGVNTLDAIYFAILLSSMLFYLYITVQELKKPSNDGSRQKATNDLKN